MKKSITAMTSVNSCFRLLGGSNGHWSPKCCLESTVQVRQTSELSLRYKGADLLFLASTKTSSCTMKLVMMLDPRLAEVGSLFFISFLSMLEQQ